VSGEFASRFLSQDRTCSRIFQVLGSPFVDRDRRGSDRHLP